MIINIKDVVKKETLSLDNIKFVVWQKGRKVGFEVLEMKDYKSVKNSDNTVLVLESGINFASSYDNIEFGTLSISNPVGDKFYSVFEQQMNTIEIASNWFEIIKSRLIEWDKKETELANA